MARIRSIKPEFWTSEQVMECSRDARLLFIGIWNFCDDAGRLPCSQKQIKALVFPGDDNLTVDDVHRMIYELSKNGLIVRYIVDDKEYLQVTGWQHQKIDKPQPAKYPPPPEHSSNDRRTVSTERKGKERKGKEEDSNHGGDGAIAPAKGYGPVVFGLADRIMDAQGLHREDPRCFGTANLAKKWHDAGWDHEVIIQTVKDVMARRGGDPPSNASYFEKAIARAIADLARPVPVGSTGPPRKRSAADVFLDLDHKLNNLDANHESPSPDFAAGPIVDVRPGS